MSGARGPFRAVVESTHCTGAKAAFRRNRRDSRWWELQLECGHIVERASRLLPPEPGRVSRRTVHGSAIRPEELAPPPRRARCGQCRDRDRARPADG